MKTYTHTNGLHGAYITPSYNIWKQRNPILTVKTLPLTREIVPSLITEDLYLGSILSGARLSLSSGIFEITVRIEL